MKHGVIGGIIAGLIFAAFEMVFAAIVNGPQAFFMPLRMIGAIVLGQQALDPGFSLVTAAITGVIVHMVFSMMFGALFGVIAAAIPALARSTAALVVAASVFGLALWLINFHVIAPAFGWNWFPTRADQFWQGFVAHTFFFGTALGLYLSRAAGTRYAR